MPEDRLARARRSLPAGYQFPTPTHVHAEAQFDASTFQSVCRCGARLNVHGSDVNAEWVMPLRVRRDAVARVWRRPSDNAAEQLARHAHWNVIEGEDH